MFLDLFMKLHVATWLSWASKICGSFFLMVDTCIDIGAICSGEMSDFTSDIIVQEIKLFFLVLCYRYFDLTTKLRLCWLMHNFSAWPYLSELWNVCAFSRERWVSELYFLLGQIWESRVFHRNGIVTGNLSFSFVSLAIKLCGRFQVYSFPENSTVE